MTSWICLNKFIDTRDEIGLDVETTGLSHLNSTLLTLQFGDYNNQYIVEYDDSIETKKHLKEILSKDKIYILQNAKFDLAFIYVALGIFPNKIYDTFLAEKVLGLGHFPQANLAALAWKYLKIKLDKSVRGKITRGLEDEEVLQYSADDVKVLPGIKREQLKQLKDLDMVKAVQLECRFVRALTYIELSGIYLDKNLWEIKCKEDDLNCERQRKLLDEWLLANTKKYKLNKFAIIEPDLFTKIPKCLISWSSPKQVIELFKKIGINTTVPDKKTGKTKDSVEAGALLHQAERFEIIPIYLQYKKYQKIVSTYGRNFYDHISSKTGRIHSKFNQLVDTGRLSSGGKDKENDLEFINLQNIPSNKRTRQCFTSMSGNILISADYDQQEQVLFANRCLDKDLLKFYDSKQGDMHSFVGSKIFPPTFEEINNSNIRKSEDKVLSEKDIQNLEYRVKAKSAGFAINYGGNGFTIASNLNISLQEGEEVYTSYFKGFPGIKKYFEKIQKATFKSGYIIISPITGRKYFIYNYQDYLNLEKKVRQPHFWERRAEEKSMNSESFHNYYDPLSRNYFKLKGEMEKYSLNYPIQGGAAEIIKLAAIYIFEYLLENNLLNIVLMSNIIHDEFLLESPIGISNKIAKMVTKSMIMAGKKLGCTRVPLTAQAHIVEWWNH